MQDSLGDRMKNFYEDRTRFYLPRRTYTIIRIDGKAFHSYTKGLKRPFDDDLISDMNQTAKYLCENIQGAKCAYVQSDEISLLISDFNNIKTSAWFDGNIQKICSISASLTTSQFNYLRTLRYLYAIDFGEYEPKEDKYKLAHFDSRVFTIPQQEEVINYFIWRQQDCIRNSIQLVAQSLFSHNELHKKDTNNLLEIIPSRGLDWNKYPDYAKYGRFIIKEEIQREGTIRNVWTIKASPKFVENREIINNLLW